MSKNKIFMFDVDGTLTPPRQPMTLKFANLFEKFAARRRVFLVSGSDIEKIKPYDKNPRKISDKG